MKKKLTKDLILFYSSTYPRTINIKSTKRYKVTLGIGGNVGDVKQTFNKLLLCLIQDTRFDILQTSPLLQNPAFGFLDQKDFLNGIITLKTNLSPKELLKNMQSLEIRYGRKRSFQDAPRTLDIDIIFFASKKVNTKKLIIPHKSWQNRESVTIPLKHI
ncbi:MAG: 2-amino-4-hydroxy-6-hydroxymethyldihydropteridine diphosphokinase [Campylobacterales bacterium]|nr:2-amino-4-hydroxy-6-hydroxymethyldihydropteridine diphosphokinase [Campylobacterales bacterium]NQY52027.1 2-amino-4-hydroxy-6-hydroxymethyldihydropteridine diphosphokinase [Campylobacteraceae bacterium]